MIQLIMVRGLIYIIENNQSSTYGNIEMNRKLKHTKYYTKTT